MVSRIALDSEEIQHLAPLAPGSSKVLEWNDWTGATGSGVTLVDSRWGSGKDLRISLYDTPYDLTFTAKNLVPGHGNWTIRFYNTCSNVVLFRFYLTPNNFSNFAQYDLYLDPGENIIEFTASAHGGGGGGWNWLTNASAVNQFRVKLTPPQAGFTYTVDGYVDVGPITYGTRSKGVILMTFDDGARSQVYNASCAGYPASGCNALDIMTSYGLKGTAYVIAGTRTLSPAFSDLRRIGESDRLTIAQIEALLAAGWTVGNHGNSNHNGVGSTEGLRTLTYECRNKTVASVDTVNDTLTITGHIFGNGHPVFITGTDLPDPLVANTTYYTRDVASNTIKLAETSGGAAINLTTTGTPANFKVWGANASDDDSAVYSSLEDCAQFLEANGVGVHARTHMSFPGGEYNLHVMSALRRMGFKTARGIQGVLYYKRPASRYGRGVFSTANVHAVIPYSQVLPNGRNLSLLSEATAMMDMAQQYGAVGTMLLHTIAAADAVLLDQFCAEVVRRQKLGLIECMTVDEWYQRQSAFKRVAV